MNIYAISDSLLLDTPTECRKLIDKLFTILHDRGTLFIPRDRYAFLREYRVVRGVEDMLGFVHMDRTYQVLTCTQLADELEKKQNEALSVVFKARISLLRNVGVSKLAAYAMSVCRARFEWGTVRLWVVNSNDEGDLNVAASAVLDHDENGNVEEQVGRVVATMEELDCLKNEVVRLAVFDQAWGGETDATLVFPDGTFVHVAKHNRDIQAPFHDDGLQDLLGNRYGTKHIRIYSSAETHGDFRARVCVAFVGTSPSNDQDDSFTDYGENKDEVWAVPVHMVGNTGSIDIFEVWKTRGYQYNALDQTISAKGVAARPCRLAIEITSRVWMETMTHGNVAPQHVDGMIKKGLKTCLLKWKNDDFAQQKTKQVTFLADCIENIILHGSIETRRQAREIAAKFTEGINAASGNKNTWEAAIRAALLAD